MKNFLGILVAVSFVFVAVNAKAATTTATATKKTGVVLKAVADYDADITRIKGEIKVLKDQERTLMAARHAAKADKGKRTEFNKQLRDLKAQIKVKGAELRATKADRNRAVKKAKAPATSNL